MESPNSEKGRPQSPFRPPEATSPGNPNDTCPVERAVDDAFRIRALAFYNRQQYSAAVDDLRCAVKIDPTNAYNHFALASAIQHKDGDRTQGAESSLEQARFMYQRSLGKRLFDFDHRRSMAFYLLGLGLHEEAISEFQRILTQNPSRSIAHRDLGWAYRSAAQYESAIAEFRSALYIDPSDVDARQNLAHVLLDSDPRNRPEAIDLFRKNTEDSSDPNRWRDLGYALRVAGQHAEAIGALNRALERLPEDPDALWNRAMAYMEVGVISEARDDLQLCIRHTHPEDHWRQRCLNALEQVKPNPLPTGVPAPPLATDTPS